MLTIQTDIHELYDDLQNAQNSWNRIVRKFNEVADVWSNLSQNQLKGLTAVSLSDDMPHKISGSVLGKVFALELKPVLHEKKLYGHIIVHAPQRLTSDRVEIATFLYDAAGMYFDADGKPCSELHSNYNGEFIILVNIALAVLRDKR